jgi:hypothetical protein
VRTAALLIATASLAAAACSSSLQQPDAGMLGVDGAADTNVPPGGFIMADVDGVTLRADRQAGAFFWSGIQDGWLDAEARNDESVWAILLENRISSGLMTGYVILYPTGSPTPSFASYVGDGTSAVSITMTAAGAGDILEGTFTATLNRMGGGTGAATKTVTNGVFRLPRSNTPPPPL